MLPMNLPNPTGSPWMKLGTPPIFVPSKTVVSQSSVR